MATPKKNAKNSKSTKTAHVLNLITSPQKKQEEKEKQAQASNTAEIENLEAETVAVPRRHLMPPILEVTRINDEEVSDQIRMALENELEEETVSQQENEEPFSQTVREEVPSTIDSVSDVIPNLIPIQEKDIPVDEPVANPPSSATHLQEQSRQATEPNTMSVEKAAPVQSPATAAAESVEKQDNLPNQEQNLQPTEPITISAEKTTPVQTPITAAVESVEKQDNLPNQEQNLKTTEPISKLAEETTPIGAAIHEETTSTKETPEKGFSEPVYINLTQVLVEKRAPHYMKMFKLCDCLRCAADVKALALTRLEPKYVISKKNESIPMLKTHEREYGEQVNAQLIRACRTVKEHPHHG